MSTNYLNIAREQVRVLNQNVRSGAPSVVIPEKPAYQIPEKNFKCYGGAKEACEAVVAGEPQVILHGPAETGKTRPTLELLDALCWQYPGLQAAIVRKVYADMPGSVLMTYEKKVLHMENGVSPDGVTKFGGEKAQFYDYPTKSRVWIGGMDHPGKVLSAERDLVVVNQAEELEEGDWETISTRTTGRGGILSPGRLLGDANPGPSTHWIKAHAAAGSLKMFASKHEDNPTLFDPETGQITPQGVITIAALDKLTGVRHKRLRLGLWVAAEGVVYEFDPEHHKRTKPVAEIAYYVAGVDWGFTNPGVIQVWGIDNDGRMYRVHEVYRTGKLVAASEPKDAWWINKAKWLREKYNVKYFIPDPARPDHIEAFENAGLSCVDAYNSVELGIQNVQSRLKVQEDGYPRIMFLPNQVEDPDQEMREPDPELRAKHKPTSTEEEMEVYAYPKVRDEKDPKEEPEAKNNHGCDVMRYVAADIDGLGEDEFVFA